MIAWLASSSCGTDGTGGENVRNANGDPINLEPTTDALPARQGRPPQAFWFVLSGVFMANGVFHALNDHPLLLVVLSLIAGLAALWAGWAEGVAR